jgi:hypothetical protein
MAKIGKPLFNPAFFKKGISNYLAAVQHPTS